MPRKRRRAEPQIPSTSPRPRSGAQAGRAPAGRRRPSAWSVALATAGVALITLLVFSPVLRNDFVDWDDPDNFLRNPHYRGLGPDQLRWMFTTFHMGHYQPLSWMTLGWDYLWGQAVFGNGLDPRPYHATNLLLHAANAGLVCLLLRRLGRSVAPSFGPTERTAAAVLGALFWSLHPLRVESVAWATERRDVLSSFFLLLTILAYLRAAPSAGGRRVLWLAGAILLYGASLLSRAMGITLPVILLLLDAFTRPWADALRAERPWWPPLPYGRGSTDAADRIEPEPPRDGASEALGGPGWGRLLLEKLPFVVLAAAAAVIAVRAQAGAGAALTFDVHGPLARALQACYGLVFYIRKTLLPWNLGPIYELRPPIELSDTRYLLPLLLVSFGAIGAIVLLVRRKLLGLAVGAAAYALLALPVLGLAQSGHQEVADRYSYLPAIALSAVLAGGLQQLRASLSGDPTSWRGVLAGGAAVVVGLAALTWRQCGVWRNTAALWTQAAQVSPDSSIARNGYGYVLLERQQYEAALDEFRIALELQPRHEKAWHNLWEALRALDRPDALLAAYREAIRVHPRFVDAHYNLGVLLSDNGDAQGAEAAYRQALALRPAHDRARTNLGLLLLDRGAYAAAEKELRQAILDGSRNMVAQRGLARVLKLQGRTEEAFLQLQAALTLDPNDARTRQLLEAWEQDAGAAR